MPGVRVSTLLAICGLLAGHACTAESIQPVIDLLYKTGFTEVSVQAAAGGGPVIPQLPAPAVRDEVAARAATLSLALMPNVPEALLASRVVTTDGAPVGVRAGERWGGVAPRVFAAAGPGVRLQVEAGG
jgi:hypothetical protein